MGNTLFIAFLILGMHLGFKAGADPFIVLVQKVARILY